MDEETRINNALGKLLRNYNYLELNLGLCLRHLAKPDNPDAAHSYLNRAGMPQVIQRLEELLEKSDHMADTTEFQQWIKTAEEIRQLRNYYAHATWAYLPLRDNARLEFRIPPWRKETIRGDKHGEMQIEALEADADRVQQVFNEFMAIRKKHRI